MLDLKFPEAKAPDYPKSELPALRRASDIMYGVYKLYREDEPVNNLRYVLILQIINPLTQRLIMAALSPHGWFKVVKWPGVFFGMRETPDVRYEAAALLGSPVATPLAYMLLQHKAELGDLRIVGVRIFAADTVKMQVCMLWYLKGPAPAPPKEAKS